MDWILAPSMLAADFGQLDKDVEMINESQADWFHLDIMDGSFVPNISYGFPVIDAIRKKAKKPLDVHMMVVQPERYFERFRDLGADIITVHYEACPHLHRSVQQIRDMGMKAGVVLNPHTPVSLLKDILPSADVVCLMSVNPGFGGQKFIENVIPKIEELADMIKTAGSGTLIEVDGGVGLNNAASLLKAGARVLVAGSAVFAADNPTKTIEDFKSILID